MQFLRVQTLKNCLSFGILELVAYRRISRNPSSADCVDTQTVSTESRSNHGRANVYKTFTVVQQYNKFSLPTRYYG